MLAPGRLTSMVPVRVIGPSPGLATPVHLRSPAPAVYLFRSTSRVIAGATAAAAAASRMARVMKSFMMMLRMR